MKLVLGLLLSTLSLATVILLALAGYQYPWTGFAEHQPTNGDVVPAKTLWDWLELLIVPTVLAVGAFLLDGSRKRSEQAVESDRQRQQTLDDYIDKVSDLLISNQRALEARNDATRELARTRTLTALRLLDGSRKAQLLQFLYEANLVNANPVIQLNGADFRGAVLDEATLCGAELRGVHFAGASIRFANLSNADLRGSDFSNADLTSTNLGGANLRQAILCRAELRRARLAGADLLDADLTASHRDQHGDLASGER